MESSNDDKSSLKWLEKVIAGKKPKNLDHSEWVELDKKELAHINDFVSLLIDIKNIEVQIDHEDQTMLLLFSLPFSYNSFKETLICGRDKLSFEEAKGNLLRKYKINNEFGLDSSSGYIKADCYIVQNKNWRATERNKNEVADANMAEDKGDNLLLVTMSERFKSMSEWILDSWWSFHIFPNRDWFSTYSLVESGVVRMRNGSHSKIIDFGIVSIKMYDGIIKTLLDVRHVPGL
ncbi:hypothetical protein Golax_023225 [Gossypium laxum]|uniref:Retrovirus-related Pol polyprotein from transposon TNT 1-94-like beta-barrel domain-containing protein n=1 Tax=Gossypium laxum TaxID=34288 RepID=A0A7J9AY76_9ROSI|nr:hypothetical protein [Gossypium laxum]